MNIRHSTNFVNFPKSNCTNICKVETTFFASDQVSQPRHYCDQLTSERRFIQIYLTIPVFGSLTMANCNLVKVFLLVTLLGLSLMPFCQAHPKRGRKRAFGK